ncbi:carbonic anhydrase-related protein 10-like [Pollicipes pollicipes]|uniref:carbonic anhydrase-related protein 10-like n=1 Tax=Pollicipes pollicipes TaxID=41117 RepID=UPI001884DC5A|nr:carbonic anhydrase-related protein 10-like [Pollicipes pollicipes]
MVPTPGDVETLSACQPESSPLLLLRQAAVEAVEADCLLAGEDPTWQCSPAGKAVGSWEGWWTYDGVSGVDHWGVLNPNWKICKCGRKQSPINFEPDRLLFDTHLRFVHVDKHEISGTLNNTGHDVTFFADQRSSSPLMVSGGPLSYQYRFERFHLHFGTVKHQRSGFENATGSEHRVDGQQFPAEIQLLCYSSLYDSFEKAVHQPNGVVGIAILIQMGDEPNRGLRIITDAVTRTTYKDDSTPLESISLHLLLPQTEQFLTYEGSLTTPPCYETVTWIVFNKPIYMNRQQLHMLKRLRKSTAVEKLGNNFRPPQPLHHRVVRTNIDFRRKVGKGCPSMKREMGYKASKWLGA